MGAHIMLLVCLAVADYYCKFGNFPENFIFTNSFKRHVFDAQNLCLRHDLPISVNNSDFAISVGFYFHETLHMQSFTKIKPSQKFPNLQ